MERSGEYLRQAYELAAKNSTDTSTNTGAIIVGENGTVVGGWNHFPIGVAETPERLERSAKSSYVIHAEPWAIYYCARYGIKTDRSTMYATWAPCDGCARAIVNSGIARVVAHKKTMDITPERWMEQIRIGLGILKEGGVIFELWEGDIGGVKILFNKEPFQP